MGIPTYSSWHASTHSQKEHLMDPTTVFCPNRHCHARGQTGMGNIGIHSRKEQRFLCHACQKTFSARTGTVFYRLRTSGHWFRVMQNTCCSAFKRTVRPNLEVN